jgi:Tfp pilus assembly protein PilV
MKTRWQAGDTLVEITIALAILAMVLTSCVLLGTSAMRVGSDSKQRSQAAELAQEQAEGLRSYRDIAGWTTFNTDPVVTAGTAFHMDSSSGDWEASSGPFSPNIGGNPSVYTVSMVASSVSTSERRFDITVRWQAAGGRNDSVNFSDYLVDPTASSGYVAP